jgi:hypothetical protein
MGMTVAGSQLDWFSVITMVLLLLYVTTKDTCCCTSWLWYKLWSKLITAYANCSAMLQLTLSSVMLLLLASACTHTYSNKCPNTNTTWSSQANPDNECNAPLRNGITMCCKALQLPPTPTQVMSTAFQSHISEQTPTTKPTILNILTGSLQHMHAASFLQSDNTQHYTM